MPKGTESPLFTTLDSTSYVWGQQANAFGRFPAIYFKGDPGANGVDGINGANGAVVDVTVYSGITYPDPGLGIAGDIYLKYDDSETSLVSRGLRMIRTEAVSDASNIVIADLNGTGDEVYWLSLNGTVEGNSAYTILLLPNGDTTAANYHSCSEVATDISSSNANTSTTYIANAGGLPITKTKYSANNYLTSWGSIYALDNMYRISDFSSTCMKIDGTEGLCRMQHSGAWKDASTVITSLTISFGGASNFSGKVNLYCNR